MKLFLAGNRTEAGVTPTGETTNYKVRSFVMEQCMLAGALENANRTYMAVMATLWNDFKLHTSSHARLRVVDGGLELVGLEDEDMACWDSELQALSRKLFADLLDSGAEALNDVDRLASRLQMPQTHPVAHSS